MSDPVLLITRPAPAATRFAAEVRAAGLPLRPVIAPLLRIVSVAHDAAQIDAAPGLVLTSESAVTQIGKGHGRPAICVGPRTAAVARAAGFDVTTGPGDAAGLAPMLADLAARGWLHPHGAHKAADLPVPGIIVYDQIAQPLPAQAASALGGPGPVVLTLFSPRSAHIAGREMADARAALWIAAISASSAERWTGPHQRLEIAPSPDAAGMMAALRALLSRERAGGPPG